MVLKLRYLDGEPCSVVRFCIVFLTLIIATQDLQYNSDVDFVTAKPFHVSLRVSIYLSDLCSNIAKCCRRWVSNRRRPLTDRVPLCPAVNTFQSRPSSSCSGTRPTSRLATPSTSGSGSWWAPCTASSPTWSSSCAPPRRAPSGGG